MKTTSRKFAVRKLYGLIGLGLLNFVVSAPAMAQTWATESGTNNIYYNSGNVGIGTQNPAALFDLNIGTTYTADRGLRVTGSYPNIQLYSNYNNANARNWAMINPWNDWGQLEFRVSNAQNGDPLNSGTSVLVMSRVGNVGIGAIAPSSLLELKSATPVLTFNATNLNSFQGAAWYGQGYGATVLASTKFNGNSGEFRHEAGYTAYGGLHTFFTNGSERLRIDSNGNVGIGVTSPGLKLQVSDTTTGGAIYGETSRTGGNNYGVQGGGTGSGATMNVGGYFFAASGNANRAIYVPGNYPSVGSYNYSIYSESAAQSYFVGSVGIGASSPSEKLEVNGNLKLTGSGNINAAGTIEAGNIKAKYQDVAEWVPAAEQLAAGTVVVLDSTKSNQVISSSQSYDTRVAGVISAQPGIALGEQSDNKVLVATTGRVKVKVDASKRPIHIGDLLVTSDVPGLAMKSEEISLGGVKIHRPGTLIGKALEPLEKGKGEILVLLSLQ